MGDLCGHFVSRAQKAKIQQLESATEAGTRTNATTSYSHESRFFTKEKTTIEIGFSRWIFGGAFRSG
jgi:hypothetical protein